MATVATLALLAACGQRGELLGSREYLPTPPRFGAPVQVTALANPAIDEDPTFTGDLLDLFFMSMRAGDKDIWTSRRAVATEPWGAPTLVAELSAPVTEEYGPAITLNGLAIWFVTNRDGGRAQLWRATRETRAASWATPRAVPELASSAIDTAPTVDPAERTLYFASDRAGGSKFDIYVSTRPSLDAPWGTPTMVPGISSAVDSFDPFIAANGLLLFLTRMNSPKTGDIYWTARTSTTEPWSPAVPLDAVNSPSYDSDATLSPDLGYMMFSSMRTGNGDIYEARALP